MKQAILMGYEEPTDIQLAELMKEVAEDAKQKADNSKIKLAYTIIREILIAHEKHRELIK
ncbi:MAG: hypothetical protein IPM69_01385 [Ignavibacteria bacterium]|nr:hypothetical protein [Ignavibacteria bacterium]